MQDRKGPILSAADQVGISVGIDQHEHKPATHLPEYQ
jgi:hypothetical protein